MGNVVIDKAVMGCRATTPIILAYIRFMKRTVLSGADFPGAKELSSFVCQAGFAASASIVVICGYV
jgi:hypothetical protein